VDTGLIDRSVGLQTRDLRRVASCQRSAGSRASSANVPAISRDRQLRLETERLDIVPFSRALLDAIDDPAVAARLIGASIPPGWPEDELSQLLEIVAPWLAESSEWLGYGPWVVISRHENSVVGSAGFLGSPNEDGAIELGFGIHQDFRNRGYAAEAAGALVGWGLAQRSVDKIVAKCRVDNAPSVRVLEKIGMTPLAECDGMLHWAIEHRESVQL
jgi:RimJ/RimL family protein N-acetyltransferase